MLTSLEMIDSPRLAREEWRGEWGWILPGAAASCRPAMAPPQCHFTSDGAPKPLTHTPAPRPPSLVSGKLLQSAEALIGLGQSDWFVREPGVCRPYFFASYTIVNGYPCRYSLLPAAALALWKRGWQLDLALKTSPHPSPCSMTAEQNVAGGGLSGRARGDLATSSVELVGLVTQRQVPEMCYSFIDRPGEQRASPSPRLMPSPMAADATWRPQSLQPARRRRRAPAGSPKAHVHVMHREGLLSRQAGSLPSSPVPLSWRQSVTARLHVLCVD
ncbi:hypothetical protein D9C73_020775 [Collichthys lucidus]|uniref:Uncharacterized protein n=1 Tax=Collichthys lucidus TaxID=240159 RepID=A0A4U5VEP3_COLLU|nr:hypothetical protein D9C73_020775 [Collichthys lucidus]